MTFVFIAFLAVLTLVIVGPMISGYLAWKSEFGLIDARRKDATAWVAALNTEKA